MSTARNGQFKDGAFPCAGVQTRDVHATHATAGVGTGAGYKFPSASPAFQTNFHADDVREHQEAQSSKASTRTLLTRRQACCALGALALTGAAALLAGCGEQAQGNDGDGGHLFADADPQDIATVMDAGATASPDSTANASTAGTGESTTTDPTAVAQGSTLQVPEQGEAVYTSASGATCTVRSADERRATSDSTNEDFPGRHVCFLTFDDGPSTNTQRILGILNNYGVRATWFVKGNCGHLDELPSIWEQGNQVAIHTYTHDYEQIYASADAYWADLHQCGDAIAEQIGHSPTLVRFPGGSVNDFNAAVRGAIIEQMRGSYHYFDWNVSCGDGADHTADELVGYATGEADGCHSCCVLMHDSEAKDTTVDALPRIIQYFIDNGFEFDVLLADTFGYHF